MQVKERKRGRSAIVKWRHDDQLWTFSNLFVVQWRWGVRPSNPASFTRWQTISVVSLEEAICAKYFRPQRAHKPYAILKHLLSPGRYYQFRVAAVDK